MSAQRKAVADLGDNLRSFPTTFSQVTSADDDFFRVSVGNRDVLRIPSGDKDLQVRWRVFAHMRSAGHQGVVADFVSLEGVLRLVSHGVPCWRVRSSMSALCGYCLLYTSPSPRDKRQSRMPSSA